MKLFIGIFLGIIAGFCAGYVYFYDESQTTENHSRNQIDDSNSNKATESTSLKNERALEDDGNLLERCQPLIENAIAKFDNKPAKDQFPDVDLPHPVFGDNSTGVDEIEANFSNETNDDQWAFYLKPIVDNYFKENNMDGALKSHHLDCKNSACKLTAKFELKTEMDMIKMHQISNGGEFIGPRLTAYSNCDLKRNCTVSMYFSRDPKNDPNMTSIPWRRYPTQG